MDELEEDNGGKGQERDKRVQGNTLKPERHTNLLKSTNAPNDNTSCLRPTRSHPIMELN